MVVKSSLDRYGSVAILLHWTSAILILVLLVSGFRADDMDDIVAKTAILRLHVPIGITILLLTLARIGWWFFADKKPTPIPMPSWQIRLSKLIHLLFYVVILGMAASGIGMILLSGAGPIIFNGPVEMFPDFWDYRPRAPHGFGARAMAALLIVHAGAALYHHFIKRDGLLRRMWFIKINTD